MRYSSQEAQSIGTEAALRHFHIPKNLELRKGRVRIPAKNIQATDIGHLNIYHSLPGAKRKKVHFAPEQPILDPPKLLGQFDGSKSWPGLLHFSLEAAAVGLATLTAAQLLQFGYRVTDFYPPDYVFQFAIGIVAHIIFELLGLNKKYVEYRRSLRS